MSFRFICEMCKFMQTIFNGKKQTCFAIKTADDKTVATGASPFFKLVALINNLKSITRIMLAPMNCINNTNVQSTILN